MSDRPPLFPTHPDSHAGQVGITGFDPSWWMRGWHKHDGRTRIEDGLWLRSKDGDPAFILPLRHHYSGAGGGKLGLPPGRKLVLVRPDGLAIAGFTAQRYRSDDQTGICMNVFARWGGPIASDLIRDSVRIAREQLGDLRLFTFVKPSAVRSTNPGYCYQCAGWTRTGTSASGLWVYSTEPGTT